MAMDAALVWCVRVVLAILLIGTLSLLAALILLVRDTEAALRHDLGNVAMWCFAALGALISAMLAFFVIRRISRRVRSELSRRSRFGAGRSGENQDGGL